MILICLQKLREPSEDSMSVKKHKYSISERHNIDSSFNYTEIKQ